MRTVAEFQAGRAPKDDEDGGEQDQDAAVKDPIQAKSDGAGSLDAHLRENAEKIRALEDDVTTTMLQKRYAIGILVRLVREDSRYGDKGVRRLAMATRLDRSTLDRASTIVRQWSKEAFEDITSKVGNGGARVSWSHLEVLAAERDDSKRCSLGARVLDEGLSVKDLRREVRTPRTVATATASSQASAGSSPVRTISATLSVLINQLERELPALHAAVAGGDAAQHESDDIDDALAMVASATATLDLIAAALSKWKQPQEEEAEATPTSASARLPADPDGPPCTDEMWDVPRIRSGGLTTDGGAA